MKRIVIYVDSLKPSGGRERVISNLMNEWSNVYELILIAKDQGDSFYKLDDRVNKFSLNIIPVHRDNRILSYFGVLVNIVKSIIKLKKTLKSLEYDYIYVATPQNAFEAYYAMDNANEKLVVSEHATFNGFNKVFSWMKKQVYPRAYRVSVPNTMDTIEYKKWGCNAVFIPHTLTFKPEKRNQLNSKIMLNVGRLCYDKHQDLLIKMWSRVENKNGWVLWIVGDGEDKEKLEMLISQYKMDDSVRLIGARKDINSIYKEASFFALTSRWEGFGMVLTEAMSFGVPCISFDCPSGPRDIINNNENGYLIDNENEKQFVLQLTKIVNLSENELSILGDKAFDTIKNWNNSSILMKWDSEIFS